MSYQDIRTLSFSFGKTSSVVDVDDHYRIIIFEGSECLKDGAPLKSHLTLVDGPYRPSDRFLRYHFQQCLAVSSCRDITEDYEEQEIENFMEELGAHLVSMFMAEYGDEEQSV